MIQDYLNEISSKFSSNLAGEHAYRAPLEKYIESNFEIDALNDPSRSEHGNPDFVFFKKNNKNLIVGYAETKDITVNLDKVENSEQLKRYMGYSNLILTNYIEFRFYKNGVKQQTISIAAISNNQIIPDTASFTFFEHVMKDFFFSPPESITNGKRLAEIMGGKAIRIRENVKRYFEADKTGDLSQIFDIIKKLLIHDLVPSQFADMYAQTLVYGLFVARYYDSNGENFTRSKARDLIPPSNPFLQQFFDHIAGPNFDKRLSYIVDELCEVFAAADIKYIIMKHFNLFGEDDKTKDPIIHFYEDFLKEYDPVERKKMGAYYTPIPVVQFIVKSVDEILKKEFGILKGLADEGIITRNVTTTGVKGKETLHKVQVLDPAVGTATFLNETIKYIYENNFKGQEGRWPSYVKNDLLPRLYGFELMMVPYTIAHLKLGMTLRESGYKDFSERIGIYLTNTLEEGIKMQSDLFSEFGFVGTITKESQAASEIKHNKPIMVVMGNPPYSVSSNNKSEFIENLVKDYKKDLNEKNIQPLSDDYIKFIRFAENLIEKNGEGIIAMITNNSFLDGVTHRHMRKHLIETFDEIYIINLHGNSKKNEISPDGSKDENVFDIQQGVSINIFIKKSNLKNKQSKVFYIELYGKRSEKFEELNKLNLDKNNMQEVRHKEPYYFFVPKNFDLEEEYKKGIKLDELFLNNSSGVQTKRDDLFIDIDEKLLRNRIEMLFNSPDVGFVEKYNVKSTNGYPLLERLKKSTYSDEYLIKILYRPFDERYIYYDPNLLARPSYNISRNLLDLKNYSLICVRQQSSSDFRHIFVTHKITESGGISLQTKEWGYQFPLYIFMEDKTKVVNLKREFVEMTEKLMGKVFSENILDYIYAILHSPNYREKYKEFLKIDFPRIPYPKDKETFWKLVEKGKELRELHLMESSLLEEYITSYPVTGTDVVEQVKYEYGKVYINGRQYFGDVPEVAWNFYIGGYQPAQKWLKDRKGRKLESADIDHYQKIIKVLVETDRIMKEIDQEVQF